MKKVALIFILTFVSACSSDSETDNPLDDLAYYRFTADDQSKLLLDNNIGDIITYKNQNDETISFEIIKYSKKKNTHSTGTFSGSGINYYYYDEQKLVMNFLNSPSVSNQIKILHERRPINFNPNNYPHQKKSSRLRNFIDFPLWNGYRDSDIYNHTIALNFNLPTITMSFNDYIFNDVRVLESGKIEVLNPQVTYPRNAHILYYDTKFGIIGFDDLNGNSWRLE